jgi:hypothetical protein
MKQLPIIKFNVPPENCDKCWKERKKQLKIILSNMDFKGLYEITIMIIGKINRYDFNKLNKFLKDELIVLKKGYIHLTYKTT